MNGFTRFLGCTDTPLGFRWGSGVLRRFGAIFGVLALSGLVFSMWASSASAYSQYSVNNDATNCQMCHGDFRSSPYVSLSDGLSWGNDLHDVHRNNMLSGDCDTCHLSGSKFPVMLGSSVGGVGLPTVSCAGCHGRAEDGTGTGAQGYSAGLRQHHTVAGVTICTGCHSDATPANFTPVDEDVLPPYYSASDAAHPLMPTDSCNASIDGFPEDYAASTLGLDNDGDDLYDEADVLACPEPGSDMMLASAFGVLVLLGWIRQRQ